MTRYLGIYLRILQANFSIFTAYRFGNFVAGIIGTLGWGFASIASMFLLTVRTSTVFGWTRQEMLLMTGLYGIFIGVFHMVFSRNFERFSRIIHLGLLDGILLKPIDSQFFLSFSQFNYLAIFRILLGVFFTVLMMSIMKLHVTLLDFLIFVFFFAAGLLLIYSFWCCIMTLTIWFSYLNNLADFLFNFTSIARYPKEAATHIGNVFVFIFIPLMFVVSVPVKVFLHTVNVVDIVGLFFFSIIFCICSRVFWQFALKFYTSVG